MSALRPMFRGLEGPFEFSGSGFSMAVMSAASGFGSLVPRPCCLSTFMTPKMSSAVAPVKKRGISERKMMRLEMCLLSGPRFALRVRWPDGSDFALGAEAGFVSR